MDFNDNNFVFSVLVPVPNITESCEFEYLPGEYIHAKIGQIVKIPFGRRGLIWGIIKSKKNIPTIKNFQLKYISQIHDAPSLSKEKNKPVVLALREIAEDKVVAVKKPQE